MTCSIAERRPEKISGSAHGTSTLREHLRCRACPSPWPRRARPGRPLDPGVGAGQDRRDGEHHQHDEAGHDDRRVARAAWPRATATTRKSRPRLGSARTALARLTTTNAPWPVWPTQSPSGMAISGGDRAAPSNGVAEVLEQPGGDAVGAGPVGRVGQPGRCRRSCPAPRRARQGVSSQVEHDDDDVEAAGPAGRRRRCRARSGREVAAGSRR